MKERYRDKNSNYCYENSNTLVNKLNIKDEKELQKYEAKITAAKLLDLRQHGVTGDFDVKHFISIHTYLFEDIYSFAGKFRNEDISKGVIYNPVYTKYYTIEFENSNFEKGIVPKEIDNVLDLYTISLVELLDYIGEK